MRPLGCIIVNMETMIKDFWNDRYAQEDFVYGTEPNLFFKDVLDTLPPGKILLPADGEGRNAVYAALQGWDAYAFDISEEGKRKAEQLAAANNATIHYQTNDFESYTAPTESFDCIALIFTHLPVEVKSVVFPRLVTYLKPGGHIILIGFTQAQLGKPSGGPKESSHLFTPNELLEYFKDMQSIFAETRDIELAEGAYHVGPASVVQLIATK